MVNDLPQTTQNPEETKKADEKIKVFTDAEVVAALKTNLESVFNAPAVTSANILVIQTHLLLDIRRLLEDLVTAPPARG